MAEGDNPDPASFLGLEMLSHLKLPENIYLATFLSECHLYLFSISNCYCTLNKNYRPTNIYDEINHFSLSSAACNLLHNNPVIHLQELAHQDHILTIDKDWHKHPLTKLYQKIFFRHGYHQSLILPVRKDKLIHGLLIFNRGKQDNPFNSLEIKQAKSIRKHLESGFLKFEENHNNSVGGIRSGLIVVNHLGEMTQCCPEGQNLLSMALQRKADNLERVTLSDVRSLPGIIQLVERLLDTPTQETNAEVVIDSYWGCFRINGFPVLDEAGNRSPQIYLNITWEVPFSLMLFYNIRQMGFTPKQQLVGLLYAYGDSTKAIAHKLELSLYTVKEHVQHIFQKLKIHTRAELIENIICQHSKSDIFPISVGSIVPD